jgi:hypothetical protein
MRKPSLRRRTATPSCGAGFWWQRTAAYAAVLVV